MRARFIMVVGACLLGLAAWSLLRQPAAPTSAKAAPQFVPPTVLTPPAQTLSIAHRNLRSTHEADAEDLLRQLEPLAVSDKPRALDLALAADRQLPEHGIMAEARRALIVTLLVDAQRMSEARVRARDFLRGYATSRYAPLVRGVTGLHSRPSPRQLRDAR